MIDIYNITTSTIINTDTGKPDAMGMITPIKIAREMVDVLPEEVFNKDSKFLDIACKSGNFLREIYERLMNSKSMIRDFPDRTKRDEWILNNQLYGLSFSKVDVMLSTRNVYGTILSGSNIVYVNKYIDYVKGDTESFKNKIKEIFGDMRFDVVIGNPPYNKGMDLDFVDKAYEISKDKTGIVCMITPAKWQTAKADQRVASKITYGQFRERYVPHMSHVCFYPDCLDVFCISESSGIAYFLIDKDTHENSCIVNNKCNLQKIINSTGVRDITHQQSLWNIGNEVVDYLHDTLKKNGSLEIKKVDTCKEYCVLMNTQGQKQLGQSGAYDWQEGRINPDYLGKGGVAFNNEGKASVIGTVQLAISQKDGRPSEEAKEKIVIFTSDKKEHCESYISYINSKLVKFLVFINLSSMRTANSNSFRFVPVPPSGKFDHIYTDEEIYKAFNLPQKYIDVIESIIKERK